MGQHPLTFGTGTVRRGSCDITNTFTDRDADSTSFPGGCDLDLVCLIRCQFLRFGIFACHSGRSIGNLEIVLSLPPVPSFKHEVVQRVLKFFAFGL